MISPAVIKLSIGLKGNLERNFLLASGELSLLRFLHLRYIKAHVSAKKNMLAMMFVTKIGYLPNQFEHTRGLEVRAIFMTCTHEITKLIVR